MVKNKSVGSVLFNVLNYAFFALMMIICIMPVWHVACASFSDASWVLNQTGIIWRISGFNLNGYQMVFSNNNIMTGYLNTFLYVIASTIIGMFFTVMAAYALSRKDFLWANPLMLGISFTMMFSGGIIPLFMVVSNLHLTNTIWSLVLPGAVPVFNVILLINFFRGVPEALDDAARIDGASPLQILTKIYLPVSLPALATVALFSIVNHWNDYFSGLIYMSKAAMYPLQTYIQQLTVDITQVTDAEQLKQMASMNNRTFNAAKIVVSTVPLLVIYPFLQKYFVSGMVIGAVKE